MQEPAGLVLAKQFASWGMRVIPAFVTKDDDKIPLAGRDWVGKASTDFEVLERWWDERPWARVGLVSGLDSLWLLDIDGPEAVDFWRGFVVRHGGWVPGTLCYRTPGKLGGMHILYRPPRTVSQGGWYSGADIPQAKVRLPGGGEVQLRGKAHWSLVIGPRRPSGEYELLEEPGPNGPIEAPESLFKPFLAEAELVAAVGVGGGDLEELREEDAFSGRVWTDGRKNAVAGLAWALSIRGASYEEVLEKCEHFAKVACSPCLDLEVVRRKVDYTWIRVSRVREQMAAEKAREMVDIEKWIKRR